MSSSNNYKNRRRGDGSRSLYSSDSSKMEQNNNVEQSSNSSRQQYKRKETPQKLVRIEDMLNRVLEESSTTAAITRRLNALAQISSFVSSSLYGRDLQDVAQYLLGAVIGKGGSNHVRDASDRISLTIVFEDSKAPKSLKKEVAKCIVTIGKVLNQQEARWYFNWLLHKILDARPYYNYKESAKDLRNWLLYTLQLSMDPADPVAPNNTFLEGLVLNQLISLLDKMDRPDSLPRILDLLMTISQSPLSGGAPFIKEFERIMDLLVGWYMEFISKDMRLKLLESFKSFHVALRHHHPFVLQLLNHLLEDLAKTASLPFHSNADTFAYMQALDEVSPTQPFAHDGSAELHDNLITMEKIASCYSAIVMGLCQTTEPTILDKVKQSGREFMDLVIDITYKYGDTSFVQKAIELFHELSKKSSDSLTGAIFHRYVARLFFVWLDLIMSGPERRKYRKTYFDQDILEWIEYLYNITNDSTTMDQEFVNALLDPLVSRVMNSVRPRVFALTHEVIPSFQRLCLAVIMKADRVKLLPTLLNRIMQEAGHSLKELLVLVHGNRIKISKRADKEKIEFLRDIWAFDVEFLESIVKAQEEDTSFANELFSMLVQSLSSQEYTSTRQQIRGNSSHTFWLERIEYSAFRALKSVIPKVDGSVVESIVPIVSMVVEDGSSGELAYLSCLDTLVALLQKHEGLVEARVQDIMVDLLHKSCLEPNAAVRDAIGKAWNEYVLRHDYWSHAKTDNLQNIIAHLIERSQDISENVRKVFAEALANVHPFITLRVLTHGISQPSLPSLPHQMTFKTSVMRSVLALNFRSVHFQTAMAEMGMLDTSLNRYLDIPETLGDANWLLDMFIACDASKSLPPSADINCIESAKSSRELLMFWASWECAKFCLLNRLRTPFGNPHQTLDAIEAGLLNMVKMVDQVVRKEVEMSNSKLLILLNRLKNAITFVDHLEIQLYNATIDVASGILPTAPKNSIMFFQGNKKICDEWFAKIRRILVYAAKMVGDLGGVVKMGSSLITHRVNMLRSGVVRDISGWNMDVDKTIIELLSATASLGDPDVLRGISKWYQDFISIQPEIEKAVKKEKEKPVAPTAQKQILLKRPAQDDADEKKETQSFPRLPWIDKVQLLADMDLEHAARMLEDAAIETMNDDRILNRSHEVMFILKTVTDCYVNTQNWTSLTSWCDNLETWHEKYSGTKLSAIMDSSYDLSYLKALASFPNSAEFSASPKMKPMFGLVTGSQIFNNETTLSVLDKGDATISPDSSALHNFGTIGLGTSASEWILSCQAPSLSHTKVIIPPFDTHSDILEGIHTIPALSKLLHNQIVLVKNDPPKINSPLLNMRLVVSKLARKAKCFDFAGRLLDGTREKVGFVCYERAKLEFDRGDKLKALSSLLDLTSSVDVLETDELRAKVYRKIALWVSNDDVQRSHGIDNIVNMVDGTWLSAKAKSEASSLSPALAIQEIAKSCLDQAKSFSEHYAKTWLSVGDFYYRDGRRMMDELRGAVEPLLMKEEIMSLKTHLPESVIVFKFITQVLVKHSDDDDSDDIATNSSANSVADIVMSLLPELSAKSLSSITSILEDMKQKILNAHATAVGAYFAFLRHGQTSPESSQAGSSIVVTLRLLRILVKYGAQLSLEFEMGMDATPIGPWKHIVPQLFARLNHPDPFVQRQVLSVILRIAKEAPHAVLYSTVSEWALNRGNSSESFKQGIARIISQLSQQDDGVMVQKVKKLVEELKKITVLPEERWFNHLGHIQGDVDRRLAKLKKEAARITSRTTLSLTQQGDLFMRCYKAIMQPIFSSLRKVFGETVLETPFTAHDRWFADTYAPQLMTALERMENVSLKDYAAPWSLLREIHKAMTKEVQRSRVLKMEDVSPYFASNADLQIPLPGSDADEMVEIKSFAQELYVLPTKTKPKRIDLSCSNGTNCTYLFKGMEDLHLDERIMQFMKTSNQLLASDKESRQNGLRVRTYEVIPLGTQMGMIKWVDNVTPLFNIFRRWQHKQYNTRLLFRKEKDPMPPAPLRPHEQFTAKMNHAFKLSNIPKSASRKEWPVEITRKVFASLKKENPKNLLSKELWSSCPDSSSWWWKTKVYSRSVAVTSVLGYILGLGDRHLDNILMDFESGEVVHIDYNVCFEKGRKLRVPETVPFRLTQNMISAFGFSGVEGAFRLSAEKTMSVLRKNKEVLTTLLEAFIYDPLVDWLSDTGVLERQIDELKVYLVLCGTRLEELLPSLNSAKSDVVKQLENISVHLDMSLSRSTGKSDLKKQTLDAISNKFDTLRGFYEKMNKVLDELNTPMSTILRAVAELPQFTDIFKGLKECWEKRRNFPELKLDSLDAIQKAITIIKSSLSTLESSFQYLSHPILEDLERVAQETQDTIVEIEQSMELLNIGADKPRARFPASSSNLSHRHRIGSVVSMDEGESENGNIGEGDEEEGDENDEDEGEEDDDFSSDLEEDGDEQEVSQAYDENAAIPMAQDDQVDFSDNEYRTIAKRRLVTKAQQRNAYAVSVLKRVRAKLDGRDNQLFSSPSINKNDNSETSAKKLPVQDHVDLIIQQACNPDNLSAMYEGWMAWI